MNFNHFKNLPRIKDLPEHEQSRQWFLYQDNLMYEARSSAIATAAASSAGGRISTPQPDITFYGAAIYPVIFEYKLNGITETGEQIEDPFNLIFNGITVFEKNTDDNYNYFITYDNETTMTFGKLKDGNITIIDTTNLSALTNNAPGSLYYEGGGNFIYLDGCPPAGVGFLSYTQSNIIRIDTEGNCEFVVENLDISYYAPTCLFPYQGSIFGAFVVSGVIAGIGPFDLETGLFTDGAVIEVRDLPGITSYKVWFVLGAQVVNDEIYLNLYISDKDTSSYFQCIAKLTIGEEVYATYISPINLDFEVYRIIFDITVL